ncbi:amino acid/amide ABC transporter substrate-binding protein (HAAT family) [Gillisia mitskevichiae]|uniref:Amino acid/amide ABC transporter substrate-binding protein (HAAT family) n=1 Tax=Gillisia mitskevichiae TaxID=270921 RepID=A0A495PSQ6_9FLAO|nr:LysM peptidoglycan-binding domain-containing protein [Gillisia mitskevichiae]RKS53561.1 amino acid/amide ABC transporter substrate-binding protein (HAAT family) [Gillisia mitskevichiae]
MRFLIIICLFFQVLTTSAFGQAYQYHTVTAGETVYSISKKYDISQETLLKLNPEAKEGLQVNAKLVIPMSLEQSENAVKKAVSFNSHKVQKKETLYSLSKEYGVSVEDIKKYNKQLYSKELQNGETIQIPVFVVDESTPEKVIIAEKKERPTPGKVIIEERNPEVTNSKPSAQILKTREHIIIPKETKYGIARKYGMTLKELEDLNPKVGVLQPGMMIKVGTNVLNQPVVITDDAFEFYEVQPQETMYSLTRRFQVAEDSLVALNPALKDGLKWGMILKVPTKDSKGNKLEDVAGLGEKPMPTSELTKMDLSKNLKNFEPKNLVLMLPYNLSKIKNDSVSNAKESIQKDRVLRLSLDFYSGALMAIDRAKELGISTNLRVYDTQNNSGKVSQTIAANNFSNVDAVIGPLYQATSEEAASSLVNLNVPVISPITNRELKALPNLYQSRPSDDMLREAMIVFLQSNSQGKNVIIVADGASSAIKAKLVSAIPGARILNPQSNNITESSLASVIDKSRENWVILESENIALLGSATSALNRLARNNRITLFTTYKNSTFESDAVTNEHLGELSFHFPSEYKEFDETVTDSFVEAYKNKYGYIPNKYTVRGYDLTLDVLLRLAAMGSIEESVKANIITEYVENKFLYKPKSNGGFYNDAIYIMQLNKDLTLSVAK